MLLINRLLIYHFCYTGLLLPSRIETNSIFVTPGPFQSAKKLSNTFHYIKTPVIPIFTKAGKNISIYNSCNVNYLYILVILN